MKKLLLLAARMMTFFCLAMVALFILSFFFWSETEQARLASQVIIIFFSMMGFFVFCLSSTAKDSRSSGYREVWNGSETEKGCRTMGYAMSRDAARHPFHDRRVPRTSRLKVVMLAALGYAYFAGILLLIGAFVFSYLKFAFTLQEPLIFLIMSIPVLLIAGAFVKVILKAVWFRMPFPEGLEIIRDDAPELFEAVNRIRKKLGGPKIGRILLTDDFNAFIAQRPRLGFLGWYESRLVLGLPLLQALTPMQMQAVLAHEYGHLSGRHGRLISWAFRTRKSWMRIVESLEGQKSWSLAVLTWFYRWYVPYFNACTFSLARAHEYEADRCSCEIAGEEETADALVRYDVLGRYLHECFWPMITNMADERPDSPQSVYGLMQEKFSEGIDEEQAAVWLEKSLSRETDSADTHPCLRERLQAIHVTPAFKNSLEQSAAQYFITSLNVVRKWFDEEWCSNVRAQWLKRYVHVQKTKSRIEELAAKAKARNLKVSEAWELAYLTEEILGSDRAFPFYERILKYKPKYVPALYAIGRISLAKGDESGVASIEKVISLDANYSLAALETLYEFYLERGDREKSGKYYQMLSHQRELAEHGEKIPRSDRKARS
ncbi:MAG TPA: M48 family metallopeptidase [Deltaproteobacteria bacterium]|nr:M48 family metallopeptidase [Deltaproteobacteria bacterium]